MRIVMKVAARKVTTTIKVSDEEDSNNEEMGNITTKMIHLHSRMLHGQFGAGIG